MERVVAWSPKYRLTCASCTAGRDRDKRVQAPVAVVKTERSGKYGGRALCMDHLVGVLSQGDDRPAAIRDRAIAKLLDTYRDEYEEIRTRIRDEAIGRALAGLPEPLTEELRALDSKAMDPQEQERRLLEVELAKIKRRLNEISEGKRHEGEVA